jgi:hypothetical protein
MHLEGFQVVSSHFWALLCLIGLSACMCAAGACMCAAGALCGFRALVGGLRSLLKHSFVSDVSSHCPCLRGPRLVFFRWSLFFAFVWLSIACWSFFYSFFSFSFSFSFLSCFYMCVLSMHSSRGRLRTMCGSSTAGWLLPSVMSDWQRCVD